MTTKNDNNKLETQSKAIALEKVLVQGDLSSLNTEERIAYYNKVCDTLGLNPFTKPFDYIVLKGKLTLYAKRDCCEQLRKLNGISLKITKRERVDDIYIVQALATDKDGRTDEGIGAVFIGSLNGEDLANALMKAETKAKRRVTLSISGLGFLDEIEVESVTQAESNSTSKSVIDVTPDNGEKRADGCQKGEQQKTEQKNDPSGKQQVQPQVIKIKLLKEETRGEVKFKRFFTEDGEEYFAQTDLEKFFVGAEIELSKVTVTKTGKYNVITFNNAA